MRYCISYALMQFSMHFLHSIWNIVFSISSACKKVRAIIILLLVHTQSIKEDQVSCCVLFMYHYEGKRRLNLCVNLQVYENLENQYLINICSCFIQQNLIDKKYQHAIVNTYSMNLKFKQILQLIPLCNGCKIITQKVDILCKQNLSEVWKLRSLSSFL